MFSHWVSRHGRFAWVMGLVPTVYFMYVTIGITTTLLGGGTWPPPPPNPGKVTVDLLQSLGFLVALTALVFAIGFGVVSRLKDYMEAAEETNRIYEQIDEIHESMNYGPTSESIEHQRRPMFLIRWMAGSAARFVALVASAITWHLWFWLVYGLIYVGARGHWLFSNASFSSAENGTTLITINVLATMSLLWNWGFVVILMTERAIHVGRNMKRTSEARLEDAKTALRNHQWVFASIGNRWYWQRLPFFVTRTSSRHIRKHGFPAGPPAKCQCGRVGLLHVTAVGRPEGSISNGPDAGAVARVASYLPALLRGQATGTAGQRRCAGGQ